MNHDHYDDAYIAGILNDVKTVAIVGASANEVRPSFFVLKYLIDKGYTVQAINPGHAGKTLYGARVLARLSDIDGPVDMVDIFRRSEHVLPIVAEALEHLEGLRTIWMQIGVRNEEAAALAKARGLNVVQDRCPKIEYQRLFGELRKGGFNTGIISSRLHFGEQRAANTAGLA